MSQRVCVDRYFLPFIFVEIKFRDNTGMPHGLCGTAILLLRKNTLQSALGAYYCFFFYLYFFQALILVEPVYDLSSSRAV